LEVARQTEAWEDGVYDEEILQETRLFDQEKQETRSMRGKEGAADYRYFPEPDLLPAKIDEEMYAEFSKIPELPDEKRDRFISEYKLNEYNANVITSSLEMAHFFEDMLKVGGTPKTATTWLTGELQGRLKGGLSIETSPVDAATMGMLVKRIDDQTISGKAAKEVLDYLMENKSDVDSVIDKLGLKQVTDMGAIEAICDAIIAANEDKAEQYRGGKDKLFGFFVGQVMKESKGSASPQAVNEVLKAKLG
jgi:aspartyl-tRNA(Asn)/glutamyl-tRNA(Gln) amidotransferase subunit B